MLAPHPLLDFRSDEHRAQLEGLVRLLAGEAALTAAGETLAG